MIVGISFSGVDVWVCGSVCHLSDECRSTTEVGMQVNSREFVSVDGNCCPFPDFFSK
jgi:hypothetical protein